MKRIVLTAIAWLVTAAVLAPLCLFSVILAGPHSSMLPSLIQPVVLALGWLIFLVGQPSPRGRRGGARVENDGRR